MDWRWIVVGLVSGLSAVGSARAESEPPPPCMSPDGFPLGVRQDFSVGPTLPANAPAFPLVPSADVPERTSVLDGDGAEVAASLGIDDQGWLLVETDEVVQSESLMVSFEDACRVLLETEPTTLERTFQIAEEAELPDTLEGTELRETVIGDGCQTGRSLQVDVRLPEAFAPWYAALHVTLALRPTGDALDNPTYQGTTVARPYVLYGTQDPVVEDGALVLTQYVGSQCSAVELSASLAPGTYEAELSVELAGVELDLEPLLTVVDMPEAACAPCADIPEPEDEPEEPETEVEVEQEADSDASGQGCTVGTSAGLPALFLLLRIKRRRTDESFV